MQLIVHRTVVPIDECCDARNVPLGQTDETMTVKHKARRLATAATTINFGQDAGIQRCLWGTAGHGEKPVAERLLGNPLILHWLLVPIALEHLLSGIEKCRAFLSRSWRVVRAAHQ